MTFSIKLILSLKLFSLLYNSPLLLIIYWTYSIYISGSLLTFWGKNLHFCIYPINLLLPFPSPLQAASLSQDLVKRRVLCLRKIGVLITNIVCLTLISECDSRTDCV